MTLNFQLERVNLFSKRYYIMDTPGFDTDKEQDVFREIVRGIEAVQPHAKIVGVMLVTRINDNRAEAVDNKLVAFVDKLCGPKYAGQITAVTNFWNVSEPEEKMEFEMRLEERLHQWRAVLGQEMKQYQHGRRYNSFGEDAGECLKWRGDSDDIKAYAKAMVDRHYGGIVPRDPVIVQELFENQPLGKTAAGEFLGIPPPPQSSSGSTSASSPGQTGATTPPPPTSEPEAEEIPRPSASSDRANPSQSRPQMPPEPDRPNLVEDLIKGVFNNVLIPAAQDFLANRALGVMMGGAAGGAAGGFPSHLGTYITPHNWLQSQPFRVIFPVADTTVDPLSSHDHFVARGLPGDLGSRTQYAQARGINLEPGSPAFGDAVRSSIMRERPL